jgi:hypothetical protein
MARESIKINHGALDEVEGKEIILRGAIDPSSLHLIGVGEYQREVLSISTINGLVKAFENGSVPDIDLGMRGGNYRDVEGTFYLYDPTFIVDGLQRVTAAMQLLASGKSLPRLGASIHFNTTEEWERDRFDILNGSSRVKLSPNVLLRNLRHKIEVVTLLHSLTVENKTFVMRDRVCWQQCQQRRHLLSARTFLRTVAMLHAHIGPCRSNQLSEITGGLQKVMDAVGPATLVANTIAFYELIEKSWGIKAIAFKEGAIYMRETFLTMLATLLSRHEDFWKERKLFIDSDLQRKIATFPLTDPSVRQLASAGSQAMYMLLQLMADHVNSGKRTKRLKIRPEFSLLEKEERIAVPQIATTKAEA